MLLPNGKPARSCHGGRGDEFRALLRVKGVIKSQGSLHRLVQGSDFTCQCFDFRQFVAGQWVFAFRSRLHF
jgi:hypothetical protein